MDHLLVTNPMPISAFAVNVASAEPLAGGLRLHVGRAD